MPVMYILACADGSYYTSGTRNLARRLGQQETGTGPHYTCIRRPLRHVYAGTFGRNDDTFRREKQDY